MIGVPRAIGGMEFSCAARACCVGAVCGGAVSCASVPCRTVACAGDTIVVIFTWPWATYVVANGAVSCNGTCWSSVGDTNMLRLTLLLG